MATPPFSISISLPGDSDIVSQFPGVDRTLRDIVNSWLNIDHDNTTGGHKFLTMTAQNPDPTFAGAQVGVWAVQNGQYSQLKKRLGAGTVEYVGNPPGTVIDFAGAVVPFGYLICDGSAVSRTAYPDLFAVIGTVYGIGNGTTTFNLPDLQGRVVAGFEYSVNLRIGNLATDTGTISGTVLGSVGGSRSHIQTTSELVSHGHNYIRTQFNQDFEIENNNFTIGGAKQITSFFLPFGISSPAVASDNTGGGAAMALLQPTMIMQKLIKF